jgi:Na+/proline symporter
LRLGYISQFVRMRLRTNRYNNELQTSELFSTAGRTVKSGLVASAVVSSWTWAATLLTSSGVAYRYGVSGPLWVRYSLEWGFQGFRIYLIIDYSMLPALLSRFSGLQLLQ